MAVGTGNPVALGMRGLVRILSTAKDEVCQGAKDMGDGNGDDPAQLLLLAGSQAPAAIHKHPDPECRAPDTEQENQGYF